LDRKVYTQRQVGYILSTMNTDETIEAFRRNGGLLRTMQALDLGIHPRMLYRLRDEGILDCISRGVFRLSELPPLTNPDLVTVALRIPKAVVCLVSALAHHGVTTQIPHEVQIALPRGTKKPKLDYPPIQVHQFTGAALTDGVDVVEFDGIPVQIYSLAKSVADCFRFRSTLGTDVAVQALQEAVRSKGVPPAQLLKYARVCNVETVMRPYLEAV